MHSSELCDMRAMNDLNVNQINFVRILNLKGHNGKLYYSRLTDSKVKGYPFRDFKSISLL